MAARDAGDAAAEATPEMVAAAWRAFRGERKGTLLGPGPRFKEAIDAALALLFAQPEADALREEVVAPADLESLEFGRNLFRDVIGESYKPHVWGQHRALHRTSVRFALDMADRSMPEVADVLRAMIWQQVIVDNRAVHAWQAERKAADRSAASDHALAEARGVLRQVEWSGDTSDRMRCPCCKVAYLRRHAPGCPLAEQLATDPGPGTAPPFVQARHPMTHDRNKLDTSTGRIVETKEGEPFDGVPVLADTSRDGGRDDGE